MFSPFVKHIDTTGRMLVSRAMGAASGGMKAVRKHYDLATSYTIHECNGNSPTTVNVNFPSGKYSALNYTPTWEGHRFVEWSTKPPYDAEVEYLESKGGQWIDMGADVPLSGFVSFDVTLSSSPAGAGIWGQQVTGTRVLVFFRSMSVGFMDAGTYGTINFSTMPSVSVVDQQYGGLEFDIVPRHLFTTTTSTGGPRTTRARAQLRSFSLKDANGVLVRDFIPVRVGTTGYLYDRVSGTLFGNAGSGDFVIGSDTKVCSGRTVLPTEGIDYDVSDVYAAWQLPTTVTFDATTNGGQMPSGWVSPDYYEGQPYGTLPKPTKAGEVFIGWFTSGGTLVTESSAVTSGTLTARYMEVTYDTSFEVTTASTYRKAGIYSTTSLNSSNPTVVDWGDGTTDVVYGNISQLVHTYSSNGTFTVRINNSISSIALSANDSTWYGTTTNNSQSIRKILSLSGNITSLPNYAFYYCQQIRDVVLSTGSSNLTLGTYAFAYCFYQSAAVGTVDLSARKITSIPNYCFYYCRYLKGITWPQGLTSIGGSALRFCFYNAASTGTVEIPEGVTSISGTYAFGSCLYLTAVTLPSTLTSLNNYTFSNCTRVVTITSNRSTAPTVSSYTFGSNTNSYTGRTSYSAGTNKLYVPSGATGYNASYWSSVLLDSTKCGFTLEYMAYVPTSFPVGVKITRLSDNTVVYEGTLTDSSTCTTTIGTAPVYVGPDSNGYVLGWGPPLDYANGGVNTFYYNATTFEIYSITNAGSDVSNQYKAEWVEVTA